MMLFNNIIYKLFLDSTGSEQGEKGKTGPAGPIGPEGKKGPEGPPGPIGKPGMGLKGLPGPAGPMGPEGKQGVQGPIGKAGMGLQGLPGPMGPTGPIGPEGKQGPPGSIGPQGTQGVSGPRGPTGGITPWIDINPRHVSMRYWQLSDKKGGPRTMWADPDGTLHVNGKVWASHLNVKGGGGPVSHSDWGTHFPYYGDNQNYISGTTNMRGDVYHLGTICVPGGTRSNTKCMDHVNFEKLNKLAKNINVDNAGNVTFDKNILINGSVTATGQVKGNTMNFANGRITNTTVVKHNDPLTIRSHNNNRLQNNNNSARFDNNNRGSYEKLYIEKCGIAVRNKNC